MVACLSASLPSAKRSVQQKIQPSSQRCSKLMAKQTPLKARDPQQRRRVHGHHATITTSLKVCQACLRASRTTVGEPTTKPATSSPTNRHLWVAVAAMGTCPHSSRCTNPNSSTVREGTITSTSSSLAIRTTKAMVEQTDIMVAVGIKHMASSNISKLGMAEAGVLQVDEPHPRACLPPTPSELIS